MNPINILFFALASFLGTEDYRIVSSKVSVTIDPIQKTIELTQENLFSLILMPDDSIVIEQELKQLLAFKQYAETTERHGLKVEHISLNSDADSLNATLKARYDDTKILEEAGIYFNASTGFSLINISDWNIRSSEAVLKGNYWVWPPDKKATFVIEAFENIPTELMQYKRNILLYWNRQVQ